MAFIPNIQGIRITGSLTGITSISASTISGGTIYGDGQYLTNIPNIYNNNGILQSNRVVDLSGKSLTFSSSTNPNTLVMSGGNVGIGTATPTFSLDVVNAVRVQKTDFPQVLIQNTSTGYPILRLKNSLYNSVATGSTTGYISLTDGSDTLQGSITFNKSFSGTSNIVLNGDGSIGNNVLIGTTVDGGYRLTVAGTALIRDRLTVTASTDPVKFVGLATSGDSNVLTVDATGVVHKFPLSGLTTAITSTNIYNSNGTLTSDRVMNMSSYTLTLSGKTYISYAATGSSDNVLIVRNTNTATTNTSTIALATNYPNGAADIRLADTNTQAIRIYASNTELTTTPDGAGFQFFNNANVSFPGSVFFDSGANNNAAIIFRTAPTSTVISERMRITSDGRIGIGTSTPSATLQISPNISSPTALIIDGLVQSAGSIMLTIDAGSSIVKYKWLFLDNNTNSNNVNVQSYQSIFNPADLIVSSSSTFRIEQYATYYILGDLYNNGTIVVDGTLKVGGTIYNSGSITGSGIIE
jgi:hypothetical protein